MADSSAAQNNGCQWNAVQGNASVAQPARKKMRRTTEEPAGEVHPAAGLETAKQQMLQVTMQQLQAANVPEAGLQEFQAQWTARPDARQSAAPKAPTSWTYYSPRGERVKGVADLIKIFTTRLLGGAQGRSWPAEGTRADAVVPGDGEARCIEGPPTPNQATASAGAAAGAASGVPSAAIKQLAALTLLHCLHQRYRKEEAMAVALVVQLILEGGAGGPAAAAALDQAALVEAAHKEEAAPRNKVRPKPAAGAAAGPLAAPPADGGQAPVQADKEGPSSSGRPGPSKQAGERPAKQRAPAAAAASTLTRTGRKEAMKPTIPAVAIGTEQEDGVAREKETFDVAKHLQKGMAVLLRTEEDPEDQSGWHKPWSIARVNRVHYKPKMTLEVTWLKPAAEERLWETEWTPWIKLTRGKGSRNVYRPWVTGGVEADTVQWGTFITSDNTFKLSDQKTLRYEMHRLETGKE